jgi:hypothetical protein
MSEITNIEKRDIAYNITLEFRLRQNIPSELIYHILFGISTFGISTTKQNRHFIGAFSNEAIYMDRQ